MTPFPLTRYFTIVSAVGMVVAAFGLAEFNRRTAIDHLEAMTEQKNIAIIHMMANGIWPLYADFLEEAGQSDPDDIRRHPQTVRLTETLRSLLARTSVLKVKFYDLNGLTVFSTELGQIGNDYSSRPGFISASGGQTASFLQHRERFSAFDRELQHRDILTSYIPIRAGGAGNTVAVAEIYTDVTDLRAAITRSGLQQTLVTALAFAALYVILVLVIWRAGRHIRRQHGAALTMAAAVARAETASKAKSDFLGHMSHELRTPLNAILGFSEIIRNQVMGPIGNPAYIAYAADIATSGSRLLTVVDDVLNLVEAESGTLRIETAPTNVAEVAGAAVAAANQWPESRRRLVVLESARDVPIIHTDAKRLHDILQHLISNGIKFTTDGGSVRVAVARAPRGNGVSITITDNGIGMRAEDVPAALSPFQQVDGPLSRRFEGMGLGLPLSDRLTRALSGTLEVQSRIGQGTTVIVTLPESVETPLPDDGDARTEWDADTMSDRLAVARR